MDCSTPGLPVHHQLPEPTQTHVHYVGDAIQPSYPLSSHSPPVLSLSQHQGLFQWVHIRCPKYWNFSFSISPFSEYSGLISFRIDWLDLLAVQGTLKSLLQHHSSKAYILWCSAFFIVQLSHPYMTTGKTIALTRRPHGQYSPWNSPGQNTGVGNLSLLHRIFPTQGLNLGLLHCRQILYQLSHQRSPRILEWVAYPFSSGSSRPRNRTGGLQHCRWILYQLSYGGISQRIYCC